MAVLWKDGDVITAKKLNHIVIANVTVEENDNNQTYKLDITPDDVFDENNMPIDLIVIKFIEEQFAHYCIAERAFYSEDLYTIGIINSTLGLAFTASSRNDYFTVNMESNDNDTTPE